MVASLTLPFHDQEQVWPDTSSHGGSAGTRAGGTEATRAQVTWAAGAGAGAGEKEGKDLEHDQELDKGRQQEL